MSVSSSGSTQAVAAPRQPSGGRGTERSWFRRSRSTALCPGCAGRCRMPSRARRVALALALAGFQASIGALNDIHDRSDDEVAKPWKPLPAGRVTFAAARATALGGGLLGFLLSGAAGPAALAIGLIGYGLGVAYDLGLKRTGWGWLAFALALPLVPVYAWVGAAVRLPPDTLVVAVMGPLAGLALACANGLVDLERDAVAGGRRGAVRPGQWRVTGAGGG